MEQRDYILASRYNIDPDHIEWMNKIIDETDELFIKPQEVCTIYQIITQVFTDETPQEQFDIISGKILHHVKDYNLIEVFNKINANLHPHPQQR